MKRTKEEINKLVSKKLLKVVIGVLIEKNTLTGDWFIFANRKTNGNDVTIHGPLAKMKKCAIFAGTHNTIDQSEFYEIGENNEKVQD